MSFRVRTLMGSGLGAYVGMVVVLVTTTSASASWSFSLAAGSSAQSASAAAPPTPTGVTAVCTSGTSQTIKVSWTAVARATSYAVYDSVTGANGVYTHLASPTASPYTTGTLTLGSTYYFEVVAVSGSTWTSGYSTATAGHSIGLGTCS